MKSLRFIIILCTMLFCTPGIRGDEYFNLTQLFDIQNSHSAFSVPCGRYAWGQNGDLPPSVAQLHVYEICVLDSTAAWNNINGQVHKNNMVDAFINDVNLISKQKKIATTTLNDCVKAKPSIPADFDVKPEEIQDSTRFIGASGLDQVRQAIRINLCLGVALIRAGCGQA